MLSHIIRFKLKEKGIIYSNNKSHKEWYFSDQKQNRKYWDRYEKYLTETNMPRKAREQLDEWTDNILALCNNPKDLESSWSTKGLVHGSVQSGKTSNYIGLINKGC